MIYLDNAATAKPCKEAVEALSHAAENNFGNPSSLHKMGIEAEKLMNEGKSAILKRLSKKDGEIFFTSGATESNNTIIRGVANALCRRGKTIITTAMEHPSVARVMDKLEAEGFNIVRLSPKDAIDNFEEYIADNITPDTILVSVMAVNNENGFITDTKKLYTLVKRQNKDIIVHTDGVQGFCKIPLTGDFISMSGHKVHAFKGIGAFYAAKGTRFLPLIYGGGQQKNLRPGTEPVENIAAFSAAVKAYPEDMSHFELLNQRLREGLAAFSDIRINSLIGKCVPNILNFSVLGVRSEIMLHSLEEREIYVSSGSACSKGKVSSVPDAFGMTDKEADSAIRVSMSHSTGAQDIDELLSGIEAGIKRFRR